MKEFEDLKIEISSAKKILTLRKHWKEAKYLSKFKSSVI
jgi:hypothetical protein